MAAGGTRIGAGRRKGVIEIRPRTIVEDLPKIMSKGEAREVVRQLITPHIQPMIEAQVANAKGLAYLVIRDKASGKFIRFAGDKGKLKPSEETLEIWPKEQPQELQHSGSIEFVARLQAARQRLQER
jgi:hypothetical protein